MASEGLRPRNLRQHKHGGVWIFLEVPHDKLVLAKQRHNGGGRDIADTQLDGLGWRTSQQAQVVKVGIL